MCPRPRGAHSLDQVLGAPSQDPGRWPFSRLSTENNCTLDHTHILLSHPYVTDRPKITRCYIGTVHLCNISTIIDPHKAIPSSRTPSSRTINSASPSTPTGELCRKSLKVIYGAVQLLGWGGLQGENGEKCVCMCVWINSHPNCDFLRTHTHSSSSPTEIIASFSVHVWG